MATPTRNRAGPPHAQAHPRQRRDHPRARLGTVTSPEALVSALADAGRPRGPRACASSSLATSWPSVRGERSPALHARLERPRRRRAANREPALAPSAATSVAKAESFLACPRPCSSPTSGTQPNACRAGQLHRQSWSPRNGGAAAPAVPERPSPGERNVAQALLSS